MKDTSEKQIRRPGRRLQIFFVVVVLFIAALMLWHKYSYRGMAELPLRTGEARAASQELCARHEALRSVELRYRFPGFLKVECRAGSLTEADVRQIAQEVAALLEDEGFMASYASAYRQRYSNMEPAMVDPTINCAIVQFFLSGRSMPEHEAIISLNGGDYVISVSPSEPSGQPPAGASEPGASPAPPEPSSRQPKQPEAVYRLVFPAESVFTCAANYSPAGETIHFSKDEVENGWIYYERSLVPFSDHLLEHPDASLLMLCGVHEYMLESWEISLNDGWVCYMYRGELDHATATFDPGGRGTVYCAMIGRPGDGYVFCLHWSNFIDTDFDEPLESFQEGEPGYVSVEDMRSFLAGITVERVDTAPLSAEGGTPAALPWELPDEGEALPYEEYFSQTRAYELLDRRWSLSVDGYRLHQEGTHLYMMDAHTRELLWEIVELDGMEVVSADERWVYLIVGGTELIRMDHLGENREALFTDETGLISRMNQSDYDDPGKTYYDMTFDDGPPHPSANNRMLAVADRRVLYFWAGAEDGDGAAAYRLYLPEKRADVVYRYTQEELDAFLLPGTGDGQGPFYRVTQLEPVSNQECAWQVGNPAFYDVYSTLSDEDFPDYILDDWAERYAWCVREYHVTDAFAHYQNALTGEHREADGGVCANLSWGGEFDEGPAWWERQ